MNQTIPREDRFSIYSARANSLPATPLIVQTDGDSFFEVMGIHFHSGQAPTGTKQPLVFDAFTLQITELGSAGQGFFNVPIMPGMVCSCGQNGKALRTPFVLAPNSMLQLDFALAPANSSGFGANDNIDFALWGVKRYQMSADEYAKRRQRPYFVYASKIFTVPGTAFAQTQYIQVATDADFVVQNLCSYGDQGNSGSAGSSIDFRSALLQITDESNNKQLFENPMPWSQIAAQAKVWRGNNRLQSPLIFRRATPIRLDFSGTTTGTTDVQFGFEGYKIKD